MRLAVFASGSGSNFQSIVDSTESRLLRADVVLCVSNRETAGVLERALRHDIRTLVLDPDSFSSEESFAGELIEQLENSGIDFIALAGYLRRIPSPVVSRYHHRMVNIHPSLLPAFGGSGMYGQRVHRAVIDSGIGYSGATVHFVDDTYDTGPIIMQEPVPVIYGDTPESLADRVLLAEHLLYPAALALVQSGRVRVHGHRVTITDLSP